MQGAACFEETKRSPQANDTDTSIPLANVYCPGDRKAELEISIGAIDTPPKETTLNVENP